MPLQSKRWLRRNRPAEDRVEANLVDLGWGPEVGPVVDSTTWFGLCWDRKGSSVRAKQMNVFESIHLAWS